MKKRTVRTTTTRTTVRISGDDPRLVAALRDLAGVFPRDAAIDVEGPLVGKEALSDCEFVITYEERETSEE